jgi:DNA-binding MarR family transcriptional regulator
MDQERAFVARYMRGLSLQIMEAGAQICAEVDPDLAPTWPSLLRRLDAAERLTVMDAARELDVSHVHVQKLLKSMKEAGVVSASDDPNDGRRTFYRLTKKGRDLLPKVAHLSNAYLQVIEDIETETGDELYAALLSFKKALVKKDWKTRVTEKLAMIEGKNT